MKTILDTWSPETTQEREAVLLELDCVLASSHFCNSKRYPALLRYIVERALEGRADSLKERTLGIEVFRRPVDYDTNADTVVRYTAGEVRKRLSLYYHQNESSSGVQISLPVGSYVPEFLKEHGNVLASANVTSGMAMRLGSAVPNPMQSESMQPSHPVDSAHGMRVRDQSHKGRFWLAGGLVLLLAIGLGLAWRMAVRPQSAIDQFWMPTLHGTATPVICVGGNVFNDNKFSGTMTAGKDIDYPFVSMQLASAIARVGGLLERNGASYQILASTSTPLNDLREHPVVLLGGYNNPWTMRLLRSNRFQFSPEPSEAIVDRDHPGHHWIRDKSKPYASTDDYGLIARFRDSTTGSIVVVLAGLGRNGTEAAAQFATSPQYMQLIKARLDENPKNTNLEVVIKVSVIDGRTGSPSIEEAYLW